MLLSPCHEVLQIKFLNGSKTYNLYETSAIMVEIEEKKLQEKVKKVENMNTEVFSAEEIKQILKTAQFLQENKEVLWNKILNNQSLYYLEPMLWNHSGFQNYMFRSETTYILWVLAQKEEQYRTTLQYDILRPYPFYQNSELLIIGGKLYDTSVYCYDRLSHSALFSNDLLDSLKAVYERFNLLFDEVLKVGGVEHE